MRARSCLLVVLLTGLPLAAGPEATGLAQTSAGAAKLVVAPDPVTFTVDNGKATAAVFVRNNGNKAADLRIQMFATGAAFPVADLVTEPLDLPPLEGGHVVAFKVEVRYSDGLKRSGRIVVEDDEAVSGEPAVAAYSIDKKVTADSLGLLVLSSLVGAAGLVGVRWWKIKGPDRLFEGLRKPLEGLDPTWSFTESWASNITAVGAILGTVLGSAGLATEYFAEISTGQFLGLSFFWGGLSLLAPLAYRAGAIEGPGTPKSVDPPGGTERSEPDGLDEAGGAGQSGLSGTSSTATPDVVHGTARGLLPAAFLTTAAATGQLITLGFLLTYAHPGAWFVVLLIVGSFLAVVWIYVWQSLKHASLSAAQQVERSRALRAGEEPLPAPRFRRSAIL